MVSKARTQHYDAVAMTLHWLMAALILFDFALAISFSQFNPGDRLYFSSAYIQHMSIGMIVLIFSLFRIGWRLLHRFPAVPADMTPVMRILARTSHAFLYIFMLATPLSGWVVMSVRMRRVTLIGNIDWPNIRYLSDMSHGQRVVIQDISLGEHVWLSYTWMVLVGVHILAALYHHYFKHDDVMRRMFPRIRL